MVKKINRTKEQQEYRDNLAHKLKRARQSGKKDLANTLLKSEKNTKQYIELSGKKFDKNDALRLIKDGKADLVVKYPEKFEGLDKEVVDRLIKVGCGDDMVKNSEKFEGLKLDIEMAEKLVKYKFPGVVLRNFDKFEGLDKKTVEKIIGSAVDLEMSYYFEEIVKILDKFGGLKLDKNMAKKMIEKKCITIVVFYLDIFEGLDKEIAMMLVDRGEGECVVKNSEKFEGLNLDEEIEEKLIETKKTYVLFAYLEKFKGLKLNKEIADKMIKNGGGYYVVEYPKNFKGLELDEEIAEKLIENGESELVIKNSEKFKGLKLDKEIANKMIRYGDVYEVAINLEKFEGLDENFKDYVMDLYNDLIVEIMEKQRLEDEYGDLDSLEREMKRLKDEEDEYRDSYFS